MNLFKQLPMHLLKKTFIVLICCLLGTTISIAQDATAASLYNKGLASLKAKDYENGYPQIEEALKAAEAEGNEKVIGLAKKNGAKAAYNFGNSKRKAGATDEALTLYERGIELNPTYSSNYMGKAQVLEKKGDMEASVKAYIAAGEVATTAGKAERAAKLNKKAGSLVGKLYSKDDFDGAVAAGKAFLAVKESHSVHYYMAKSLQKKKDFPTAATHINSAIELATASGQPVADKYYWAQGNILEATGEKGNAVAAYKKISGDKYKANADYKITELSNK